MNVDLYSLGTKINQVRIWLKLSIIQIRKTTFQRIKGVNFGSNSQFLLTAYKNKQVKSKVMEELKLASKKNLAQLETMKDTKKTSQRLK